MIWDSDVILVINCLSANKHQITDLDHFYQTVDNIEAMKTPDGKKPLTLKALKEWEERCKSEPRKKDEDHDAAEQQQHHHTTSQDLTDGLLPDRTQVIHPRHPRKV